MYLKVKVDPKTTFRLSFLGNHSMQFIEALLQSDCDTSARLHAKLNNRDVQLVVNMAMDGLTMRLILTTTTDDLFEMSFDELFKIEVTPKMLAHFMTRAMTSSQWELY